MRLTRSRLLKVLVLFVLSGGLLLGAAWRWTSLHNQVDVESILRAAAMAHTHPFLTAVVVIGLFVVAGLLMVVHAAALWATALTFDPWHAVLYCELGSLASGCVIYGLARVLRQSVVKRIAGSYMGKVSHALGQRGILSLIVLHVFPICPFSILNLIAGATHIRFRDFVLGTILGSTPGILFVCLLGHHVVHTLHHPDLWNVLLFVLFVATGLITLRFFRKSLRAAD